MKAESFRLLVLVISLFFGSAVAGVGDAKTGVAKAVELDALALYAPAFRTPPIAKFGQVTPFLFRGARPTEAGIQALGALHFKTVLNIDNKQDAIATEQAWVRAQGMNSISIPLSGFFAPSEESMDQIFKVIRDPSNYPIFVHCEHGEDRTGLVVGLYRYYDQHWSADAAYREMLDQGFHRILVGLDSYYKRKTGLR
jgi:protein tyrosine/serine phosphatase